MLKSRIHPLVINPAVGLARSSCDKPRKILTRSAPGARSYVWKPGVRKCDAGPIYTLTSVSEMGPTSATPFPYLVANCPIDNSHSMNGMTGRGNSGGDVCACSPCMEDSREGRGTMAVLRLIFSLQIDQCNAIGKSFRHCGE